MAESTLVHGRTELSRGTGVRTRCGQIEALIGSRSLTNGGKRHDLSGAFAHDVARGLSGTPKSLDCKYLYDTRGSELFELICEQPEYYPTRTEEAILKEYASRIATETGPVTLVELGAGTSLKTQHILRAYCEVEDRPQYVAIDVSESALQKGRQAVEREIPAIQFHPFCGTYEEGFGVLPELNPAMVVFLGGTLGNIASSSFDAFFRSVASNLTTGDYLLLGVDLDKDAGVLEAAYNDAAGVTAEFTRNLFGRINRELGASIDLDVVEHRAQYCTQRRQIEISAEFSEPQEIYLAPLDKSYRIEAGESIKTEVSRKFSIDTLKPQLEALGFPTRQQFTDEREWFAVLLLERDAAAA